ncbi:hypothetical protein G7Z17_g4395 [Cylindrodendrum hubeiense]|uniref:FAD-binding PCMH-type domain-containing protein n=1 Tax=Cylindrodendrum hubeiense TaxID=595255 RepID=A0A9P5HF13_9HYPO|nr:hypothetical protein G7Z17_g4395 [Cylindrodendrum hubeiense]
MSIRIQDFQGMQYPREGTAAEELDYAYFNEQYATSTYQEERNMFPDLIVHPKNDEDVIRAVNWAKDHNISVAVRSGGHQYSGASSTGGKNIQIDLANTYQDLMVLNPKDPIAQDRALVYVGVSTSMKDLNAYLRHNQLFVPTGICAYVCVGGHGQTGGYGQLGRSFGLYGDNIRTIRLIDFDGKLKDVTKANDPELFYAILGGSPGNFGIVTHYIVEVFQANSYLGTVAGPNGFKGPHGIKGLWVYSSKIFKTLLNNIAQMADDGTAARNYDLCVNVLSTDFPITMLFPDLKDAGLWERVQGKIKNHLADEFIEWLNGSFPAVVVVYAQWCPINPNDKYDKTVDDWFNKFRDLKKDPKNGTLLITEFEEPMSKMTGEWIFPKEREFDLPYVKRTYATASRTLQKDKWVDSLASRIDLIFNPDQLLKGNPGEKNYEVFLSCKLSVQIQCFGGQDSQFYNNRNNGTAYSWRDSTVVKTLDCFHKPDEQSRTYAKVWQAKNDSILVGPTGTFSKQDRRVLWGSYGDWDLGKPEIWKCYYEDEEKYQRLGRARGKADPKGTFTANPFAVRAIPEN